MYCRKKQAISPDDGETIRLSPITISVLSGDYAIPTTTANNRQPMTSRSRLVVTMTSISLSLF